MHYVASASGISADLSLTSISGKPKWAPQKTTLWVPGDDPTNELAVVLVDEKGVTFTITVPLGFAIVLTRPFKQLTKTGSGAASAIFEWFEGGGSTAWNK
jgi:hypothetical protein